MQTDEEIFDWIMTVENQELENCRENVIKTAEFNYGEKGRKIAEKYYRILDGEDSFDNETDEICNDCKEKAEQIASSVDIIKNITDSIQSDVVTNVFKSINLNDCLDGIDTLLNNVVKNIDTCYDLTDEHLKGLKTRLIMEYLKKG